MNTPQAMAVQQLEMWKGQWETAMRERTRQEAARVFADPISLALVVSEAIDEEPMKWGFALQALKDGDSMQMAILATTAVYESCTERL